MKTFIEKQPVAAVALTVFLSYLVLSILSLLPWAMMPGAHPDLQLLINCAAAIAICIIFFRKLYPLPMLGLTTKGLVSGLGMGMLTFLLVNALIFWLTGGPNIPRLNAAPSLTAALLLSLLTILVVAFMEEVLFRGLLLNMLLAGWGHNRPGIYRALLLAAIFFGLMHFSTSLYQSIAAGIIIVVYTFAIGVFWGALYLRCGNLWVVGLWHGCYNLLRLLPFALEKDGFSFTAYIPAAQHALSANTAATLATCPVLLFLAWLLARKIPLRPHNLRAEEENIYTKAIPNK